MRYKGGGHEGGKESAEWGRRGSGQRRQREKERERGGMARGGVWGAPPRTQGILYLRMHERVIDGGEKMETRPGVDVVVGKREGEDKFEDAPPVACPTDEGDAVPGPERGGGALGRRRGGGGGEEVDACRVEYRETRVRDLGHSDRGIEGTASQEELLGGYEGCSATGRGRRIWAQDTETTGMEKTCATRSCRHSHVAL